VPAHHGRAIVFERDPKNLDAGVSIRRRLMLGGAEGEHLKPSSRDSAPERRSATDEEPGSDEVAVEIHDDSERVGSESDGSELPPSGPKKCARTRKYAAP
jgi:hypothetical protein